MSLEHILKMCHYLEVTFNVDKLLKLRLSILALAENALHEKVGSGNKQRRSIDT
jgi:hypothetical protein